jgi:hypothetical protein
LRNESTGERVFWLLFLNVILGGNNNFSHRGTETQRIDISINPDEVFQTLVAELNGEIIGFVGVLMVYFRVISCLSWLIMSYLWFYAS